MNPGQPMMPRKIITYEIPFGATGINVNAEAATTHTVSLNKKIVPSPTPLPLSQENEFIVESTIDASIYHSDDPYPHSWVGYHTGCGLNSAEIVPDFNGIKYFN